MRDGGLSRIDQDTKKASDRRICELRLGCHTQEQSAASVGVCQGEVAPRIPSGALAAQNNPSALHQVDFALPLYNGGTLQEKTAGLSPRPCTIHSHLVTFHVEHRVSRAAETPRRVHSEPSLAVTPLMAASLLAYMVAGTGFITIILAIPLNAFLSLDFTRTIMGTFAFHDWFSSWVAKRKGLS